MRHASLLTAILLVMFYAASGQSTINKNINSQGTLFGIVTTCGSGYPMQHVIVIANGTQQFITETNVSGYYELLVENGVYNVEFGLLGYDTVLVLDTTVLVGSMTEININMHQTAYPVSNVVATLYAGGTQCDITWDLPTGPYEIVYDDGEAEDYVLWAMSGGGVAVRFTLSNYPATAFGGRVYVGDGSFPAGGNFVGSDMAVGIMDDDGTDGLPGTILDSTIITVDNYGWVDFYGLFNVEVTEGDFYVAMWQMGDATNSAPVGVDTGLPTYYRSYSKLPTSEAWSLSPYQDFMIRAYVNGSNQNMANYSIARISNFEPCNDPASGIFTPLGITSATAYSEPINLQPGYYAYAVKAVYNCGESIWIYSNTLPILLDKQVTFNISLCDGGEQDSAEIILIGKTCPWDTYNGTTDTNGLLIFETIVEGYYDVLVNHIGYSVFELDSIPILNDTIINIELIQELYPPRNMYVDTLTNIATWNPPLITALPREDFEGVIFPPEGWQESYTEETGWFRSDNVYFPGLFVVPPGDGYYAVGTTDLGSAGYHPLDYLITPQIDLRESSDFALIFNQYYDGSYYHSGYVEYSYDNGITWDTIAEMVPSNEWNNVEIELSGISGTESLPVWIAFHSSDHNQWGSGWAIDNVSITADTAEILGYYIFLNDYFTGQTPTDERSFLFEDIWYGEDYTACVKALYECRVSEQDCFSWQSSYLKPPNNFQDEYVYNTKEVPLKWNPPLNYFNPDGLVSFNIYQDSVKLDSIPYENQAHNEWIYYLVDSLSPSTYVYSVAAYYELDIYGFSGEFDESPWVFDTVNVIWGNSLPFFEGWDYGKFNYANWNVSDTIENWQINSTIGQPQPSVEFSWDPQLQGGYSSTLTSNPLLGDMLTEGDIFLDFDLKLDNRNSTSNEKMIVEIYDGTMWFEIAEFVNSESFAFTKYNYEITQYAAGNVFQIRFKATGNNSIDIISWFIDNIHIYRECESPHDLTIDVDWYTFENPAIEICWEAPYDPGIIADWIHWDNGENFNAIAADNEFTTAIRWDADQLSYYEGFSITKVKFFICDEFISVVLKIWKGANATTLIYNEDVTDITEYGEWSVLNLTSPLLLDVNNELWVGYTVSFNYGLFPAGTDIGPAIAGYGDMIYQPGSGTWDPLSSYGLDYNWNIQVFIEDIPSAISPTPIIETKTYSSSPLKLTQGPINENPVSAPRSGSRSVQGFNIYRMEEGGNYELYDVVNYINWQDSYCYFDTVPNVNLQNGYYYKVTSTWQSDIDYCESAPALALENPEDDFVYIFLENINDISTNDLINIYPNPAKDYITITSASPITNIRIVNYVGQEVFNSIINGVTVQNIVTSNYQTGVYIVEITTHGKVLTNKIIITP